MRERMSGGAFDERRTSRQGYLSQSRTNHFISLHSGDETFAKQGSFPKSYYSPSPSPIKSDDAAYLYNHSPSPPTIVRRGEYYKNSELASTLTPMRQIERTYGEIENGNYRRIQNQIPVREPSRASDYEYYPEPYNTRADEHRRVSERTLGNSRYEHALVDKGKDRLVSSNLETKRLSRGYSHLVEQRNENRRLEDSQVNHGAPSSSSVRKCEDLGVYDSVSNNHPVRPYFHPSRSQNVSGNMWDSDCYNPESNRYDNDSLEHLQKSKDINNEETFYKQDFGLDNSFRIGTASYRTSPSIKVADCKSNDIVGQKRLLPSTELKSNWDGDSIMSKNIETNSKEHLKNMDEEWVDGKPSRMFFQEQKNNDYSNAKIDNISLSLSREYVPQRIDFGVSYIHDRVVRKNKNLKDVKKRLGGRAPVKTRLGPLQNVKQRLGPIPVVMKQQRSLPPKAPNIHPMNLNPTHDRITEAPENSENFRQKANNAFLKFSKLLNENVGNRRKFVEKGDSGSFSCSVCGSSSEFIGAGSLAQHAYYSCKAGMRSEHLGFHKALCVLMGWKTAQEIDGPWSVQKLSEPEAESVQNDLVIWPPVVFIHGNLGVNANEVRNVLQGKGVGEFLASLTPRKGPNYTLFVAGFKGTLGGYGEAVKLDNYFANDGNGRANVLLKLKGCGNDGLRGYLGIVRDLDKLDFEMRKKFFLKSRADLQSYVG